MVTVVLIYWWGFISDKRQGSSEWPVTTVPQISVSQALLSRYPTSILTSVFASDGEVAAG